MAKSPRCHKEREGRVIISIIDLLAEIGIDNVRVQYLTGCLYGNQRLVDKGKAVQVSFLTEVGNLNLADLARDRPTQREGIVCWVDRAAMEVALARLRAGVLAPGEETK